MRAGIPVLVEELTRGFSKSPCDVISRDKGDLTLSSFLVSLERLSIWESDKLILRCWRWWNMSPEVIKCH